MNARDLHEKQLRLYLPQLLETIDLTLIAEEVEIGAFRLDAIARRQDGALAVIELKTEASKNALAQLLLYPLALRKALNDQGRSCSTIHSVLITTYLDTNVVELAKALASVQPIDLYVCTGSAPEALTLVEPDKVDERILAQQLWDQAQGKVSRGLTTVLEHLETYSCTPAQ